MFKKSLLIFITTVSVLLFTCEHHNPFNPQSPDYDPPKVTITGINGSEESDSTISETITVYVSGNRSEVDIRYALDSVWSKWIEDFEGDSIIISGLATGENTITLQGRYDKESDTYDTSFTVYKVEPPGFIPDSTSLLSDSVIQIREGENCTLTVRTAGTPPFTLHWYRDTVLIDSSDADTLIITGFNESDSGMYYSIVQGRWGVARSDSVFIRYLPPVNHNPIGQPDSFTVNEDDTLATESEQSLLKNDSDADHDSLQAVLSDSTRNGTVTFNANGTFTYIPDENFSGEDSFTYKAVDSKEAESEPVTVLIIVDPINDIPVLISNNSLSVQEGGSTEIDLQHLSVNDIESEPDELIFTLLTIPENGYIYYSDSLITANAVFSQDDINHKRVTYRHNGSETTADTLFLKVSDADGSGIDSIIMSVTVLPVNDTPYIASKLDVGVTEGGIKVVSSATLVVKDNDNTADQLVFTLSETPLFGSLTLTGSTLGTGDSFTQEDIDSGRVSYSHDKSENVTRDSLAFTVKDIAGASVEKTFLFIRIGAVDDPPTANDQEVATDEDTPISITLTAVDPEGSTLTGWEVVSEPVHGTLTGSGAIRSFTPEYNWNGSDTLRFRVNDGVNWSDTGIVGITVNPVNDAPEWKRTMIELTVKEGMSVTLDLDTLLDGDPEGDEVTINKTGGVGTLSGSNWSWSPDYSAATVSPRECEISATDDGTPEESSTITITINVIDSLCRLTTIIANGSGTIQVEPAGTAFDPGTDVQVTAVPETDYVFKNWTGDVNEGDSNYTTITITMNGNKNISASFVQTIETVTFNSGESFFHGAIFFDGYYYLSTRKAAPKVLKINADSLADYSAITFPSEYSRAEQLVYSPITNKLYTIFISISKVIIAEIDPVTMAYYPEKIVDTTYNTWMGNGPTIATDGYYIYATAFTPGGITHICKYSLETFSGTPVDVVQLDSTCTDGHAMVLKDGILYITGATDPPWVAKVRTSDMSELQIKHLVGAYIATDDLGITDRYLYIGTESINDTYAGIIYRIDLENLDNVFQINTGITDGPCYAVTYELGYIWALFASENGVITRIDPSSSEYVNYQLDYLMPNEIISDGKRLLVAYWAQDPGRVQAFDPSYLFDREIE